MLLAQPKIKSVEELPAYTVYFFTDDYPVDEKARAKVLGKGDPKARLAELSAALSDADFSSDTNIETAIKDLATARGLGFGDYQAVSRLAVTGVPAGPSLTSLFRLLGKDRVRARLDRFAASL